MRRLLISIGITLLTAFGPFAARWASADSLGESREFQVNTSFDANGKESVEFTLKAVGTNGYFYVDNRYWSSLTSSQRSQFQNALTALAAEFDSTIYPRTVALWGDVANPGVDGDPRVVVALQRLVSGSGGYFETIHNYSRERTDKGNAREMVFVNVDGVLSGTTARLVAHELQHLTSFQQRELTVGTSDDVWLNEARSEYNVTNAGYNTPYAGSALERRAQTLLRSPSDSLTEWQGSATDYAAPSLFAHYLADRFGPGLLASTVRTSLSGTAAIDAALAGRGIERFGDVFSDWMVALSLNDRTLDPAYGYTQPGLTTLRVEPMSSADLRMSDPEIGFEAKLREWQPLWVAAQVSADADEKPTVTVRIDGEGASVWYGAVMATYEDGATVVTSFTPTTALSDMSVPTRRNGSDLDELRVAVSHGSTEPVENRDIDQRTVTVRMALGAVTGERLATGAVSQVSGSPVADGELIRRTGQEDAYVVRGKYRRYLPVGVLELYGFQNRRVTEVSDDVFFGYNASNYIREDGTKPVYAVWPDGTKHWLNMTAAQWDASGRDWGAIFTVNGLEANWYATGDDITR